MSPVVVRPLLLPFAIDPRQVPTRGRPNARGLRERGQKLLVAFTAVTPDDAAQGRVRFEGRRVDADRFALHQAGGTQALQDPGEDGAMRLERDQPTRARDRRVVASASSSRHPNNRATRTSPPRARQCHARSQCLRSSRSRAAGNKLPGGRPGRPIVSAWKLAHCASTKSSNPCSRSNSVSRR
jgi:hypothetical protein